MAPKMSDVVDAALFRLCASVFDDPAQGAQELAQVLGEAGVRSVLDLACIAFTEAEARAAARELSEWLGRFTEAVGQLRTPACSFCLTR